jgi:hypothetical protein
MPIKAPFALSALLVLGVVPAASAEEERPPPPIPAHRIVYENLLGVRGNPLGAENNYVLAYRARLYEHESLALRENYFGLALNPTLSPAISRFGGGIELRPLTVLSLYGGFYQIGYLSSFGSLQSFQDAGADASDTALEVGEEAGLNYPANGFEVLLRAVGLAKLGPIAVRSDTNAYYTDIGLREGDRFYYHPRLDIVVADKGWALTSDEDLAYVSDFGLVAGARLSIVDSFVDDEDATGPTMRLGPLVAYTFFDEPGASFNRPTLVGILQWWIIHPYRAGQDVHQGIPYGAVAFRFEGELFRSD